MTEVIAMHPESTDDPDLLRWVIPGGILTTVGLMARLPGRLGAMLETGPIESVRVESRAVLIQLDRSTSWGIAGPQIRDALADALTEPTAWWPHHAATEDDLLRAAAEDVLSGSTGEYIRSHGGEVIVDSVRDGRVTVQMTGACSHCPAADYTLHIRLEQALRRRYPRLVEVNAIQKNRSSVAWVRPTPRRHG